MKPQKQFVEASIPIPSLSDILIDRISQGSVNDVLPDALRAIRQHLGLEIAFISQFENGRRVFRYVDTGLEKSIIAPGDSDPLNESYCQRVVDGRLPELIHDARRLPAALELPVTTAVPIGAHLSVPIRLADGRIYGTLCCFSTVPDQSLTERDLAILRAFAEFASRQIERKIVSERINQEKCSRVQGVIDGKNFFMVYQPIFDLVNDRIVGFESLTRFTAEPKRTPDVWFKEAAEVGLGEALEMAAIKQAIQEREQLPDNVYLSLNVSPEYILTGAVSRILRDVALDRIVIEVTEHVAVSDYSKLGEWLKPFRRQGLRLAVDDAGAGYSSFRHILQFAPDIIKLDISLTRNIDTDRTRRSLAAALISFAKETNAKIIAEGVETESELTTLRELLVNNAQGYLLGRPMPIGTASALIRS